MGREILKVITNDGIRFAVYCNTEDEFVCKSLFINEVQAQVWIDFWNNDEIKLSEMARNHFIAGGTVDSWNLEVKRMTQGANDKAEDISRGVHCCPPYSIIEKTEIDNGISFIIKQQEEAELKEARETPEEECFDCKDWNRGGRCCPAHLIIRNEDIKIKEEKEDEEYLTTCVTVGYDKFTGGQG